MERSALLARWWHLTRQALPARAAAGGWVVRHDHCLQRIVLDNVLGAAWPQVLRGSLPAWRQLSDQQLHAAVRLAEGLDCEGGGALLRRLNQRSLAWRCRRGAAAPQQRPLF